MERAISKLPEGGDSAQLVAALARPRPRVRTSVVSTAQMVTDPIRPSAASAVATSIAWTTRTRMGLVSGLL
jgi:hypothetical protein